MIRRDSAGRLHAVPYSEAYRPQLEAAASALREAATYADEALLKRYLELRAAALLTNNYYESDVAWLDMKQNRIDVIIGPIETYEDALFGYKAAFEGLVLVKDRAWSERRARYATLLPALQRGLPVEARYRAETPGDVPKMRDAMNALSAHIVTLQGNGDYDGVSGFIATYGVIPPELQGDLDRVNAAGIPVDIVFEQGRSVLGLPADEQRR